MPDVTVVVRKIELRASTYIRDFKDKKAYCNTCYVTCSAYRALGITILNRAYNRYLLFSMCDSDSISFTR